MIYEKMRDQVNTYELGCGRKPSRVVLSPADYDALEAESAANSPGRPPCTNCVYHIAGVIVEEGEVTHLEP